MTELVNQLVEEIKDLIPKYVFVINLFGTRFYGDSSQRDWIESIHETKESAFKSLLGEYKEEFELDKWYDLYNHPCASMGEVITMEVNR